MRKIILLFVFSLCFLQSKAGGYMGGEMSWKVLGKDSFLITANIYLSCGSIYGPPNLVIGVNDCKYKSISITQKHSSTIDVTPVCKTQCSDCKSGCTFGYGVKKYIYSCTFVKPTSSSCCNFYLSISDTGRSSDITIGMADEAAYLESELNTCLNPKDSSPIFSNPPFFVAQVNQPFRFNLGAYDFDRDSSGNKDSFSYSLSKPEQYGPISVGGKPTYVDYSKPYSYNKPFQFDSFPNPNAHWNPHSSYGGFHLDPQTGDMYAEPTATAITTICVRIERYKKTMAGKPYLEDYFTRDFQLNILRGNKNKIPQLSGVDSTDGSVVHFTAGKKKCVSIFAKDSDRKDSIRLNWQTTISGASITTTGKGNSQKLDVCWTPGTKDIDKQAYFLMVNASDSQCPYPGVTSRGFLVFVDPASSFTSNANASCNNATFKLKADSASIINSIKWWGDDSLSSTTDSFMHHYSKPGLYKYYVQCSNMYGDKNIDSGTVTILQDSAPKISLIGKDTLVSSITGKKSCNWYINDSLISSVNCYFMPSRSGKYSVSYTDSICESERSADYNFILTGIANSTNENGIKIYPNPSTGFIRIELTNPIPSNVKLTDITGKKLFSFKVNSSYELDLRSYPKGIYFLQVQNATQSSFEKIILQ